jgi:hypothetical protein
MEVLLRADVPEVDAKVTLKLRTPQAGVDKSLVTKLNGKVLETLGQEKNWVVYAVQPGDVVQGMNMLSCTLGMASDAAITIDDMLLQVRY